MMRAPLSAVVPPAVIPPASAAAALTLRDDVALEAIPAADWDALAGDPPQPFLRHAFLTALAATGCATPRTGWAPRFVTAWQGRALVGALPLYAKAHSYGEYVFDWGWADAYRRYGRRYYPKLLCAIPFTPAPGPRLLGAQPAVRQALLAHAIERMREGKGKNKNEDEDKSAGIYSSLHVLFPDADDVVLGESLGMIRREGMQFRWTNPGYRDFADFLATFSHDKRKKVKQERRKLAESGVTFERKRGRDLTPDDWAFFFQCYERTYREHHSTPYLTPAFFAAIGRTLADNLLLVIGRRHGHRLCAALDVFDATTLWGRYWGTTEYVPGLHFEACYYQAIEFCIESRIARFEGGAQGLHKLARGLTPVATHSLHVIGDPAFAAAITEFCARERVDIAHSRDELESSSPFRRAIIPPS